ncbi:hypothetical protein NW752_010447 [Fusarium irregulare]|nr:hypothetical protein NW752_010447 [Fusarium irregulare]
MPSCGTPDLVRKIRDWGGAKIQEQYENSQPATEETEGTEDAEDGHKLVRIPASEEVARKVFMTNVILEQLYICSANLAIAAAEADDEIRNRTAYHIPTVAKAQFVDTAKWLATDAAKYRENQPEQNEIPVLAIDLRLFHKDGFERAEELCLFKPHIGQHGSELGAQDYFEEWINSYPGSNAAAATELHTSRLFACSR